MVKFPKNLPSRLNKCVNISVRKMRLFQWKLKVNLVVLRMSSNGENVPDLDQQSPNNDSETLIADVSDAYDEVVHRKMNLFLVLWVKAWHGCTLNQHCMECIALKATTVLHCRSHIQNHGLRSV